MKWIKVEDEMPKAHEWYLIVSGCNQPHESVVTMAFLDTWEYQGEIGTCWLTHNDTEIHPNDGEWEDVTHWQPLPSPPCVHCGAEMVDGKCTVLETDGCYPF